MSGEDEERRRRATKADTQAELIVAAFREAGIDIGVQYAREDDGGGIDFLYQERVILVRDTYLDQVREVVGGGETLEGFVDGVTLFSLAGAEISGVIAALDAIDDRLGAGVATPNHVLSVSPVYMCPATEPEEPPAGARPDPGICAGDCGDGVHVHVVDTGLLSGASSHPWLAGVTGDQDDIPAPPSIPPYTGHGTFIAGVARCMAPRSKVRVSNVFSLAGASLEHKIVQRLDEALGLHPDIISLSAGGTTRKNLPLLGFEAFWQRYRHHKGVVLVAAAGNNSSRRPFWPAAFPHVVSVGALAANWRSRASFSDYGGWVDVYAPGEGLVNAYATGTYACHEPPNIGHVRHFHGMARWSGTSFSTPLVAGLIAARMSRSGENSRQAAAALLAAARAQAVAGVGPVLYPCDTGDGCGCGHDHDRGHHRGGGHHGGSHHCGSCQRGGCHCRCG